VLPPGAGASGCKLTGVSAAGWSERMKGQSGRSPCRCGPNPAAAVPTPRTEDAPIEGQFPSFVRAGAPRIARPLVCGRGG